MKGLLILFCLLLIYGETALGQPNIRVAINRENFAGLSHQELVVQVAEGLVITDLVTQVSTTLLGATILTVQVAAGKVVTKIRENGLYYWSNAISLQPIGAEEILVLSWERGSWRQFHPSYGGQLEILAQADSTFMVINQLPLEEYLYKVVPSEMVFNWPREALKAQAVASRTYALRAITTRSHLDQQYHVEDSVVDQVYNNQLVADATNQAVDQTRGVVMRANDGDLLQAYYFSTSSGKTASAHQVWSDRAGDFPGQPIDYLQAQLLTSHPHKLNLSEEEDAWLFLTSEDLASFDQESPWFRWFVEYSGQEFTDLVNHNLPTRYLSQPDFVLTKQPSGEFSSRPIPQGGIGKILDLRVVLRGDGGNIMVMELVGSTGTVQIIKEYNVRAVLGPATISRGDDRVDSAILPSAFFSPKVVKDSSGAVASVTLFGGGSGHGVGMSQWAAKGLAEAGSTYREILPRFYAGVELVKLY